MESLYLLIPLSVGLVLVVLAVFGWAVHSGQFEELEAEGERILTDDPAALDDGQPNATLGAEQLSVENRIKN